MSFIVPAVAGLVKGIGASGALSLASGAVGLIGSAVQASGQRRAAEAEAQANEFNAKATRQQAESERDAAGAEADDYQRRQSRIMAERRAAGGASGITNAGSPLLVEESMLREIALGTSRIGHQGFVRESRLEDSATLDTMRAGNAREAGRRAAGATLLTGFGNAFGTAARAWG